MSVSTLTDGIFSNTIVEVNEVIGRPDSLLFENLPLRFLGNPRESAHFVSTGSEYGYVLSRFKTDKRDWQILDGWSKGIEVGGYLSFADVKFGYGPRINISFDFNGNITTLTNIRTQWYSNIDGTNVAPGSVSPSLGRIVNDRYAVLLDYNDDHYTIGPSYVPGYGNPISLTTTEYLENGKIEKITAKMIKYDLSELLSIKIFDLKTGKIRTIEAADIYRIDPSSGKMTYQQDVIDGPWELTHVKIIERISGDGIVWSKPVVKDEYENVQEGQLLVLKSINLKNLFEEKPNYSAEFVFSKLGMLSFLAKLSSAAYALNAVEPVGPGLNDHHVAFVANDLRTVKKFLTLLTPVELPSLAPKIDETSGFKVSGLIDGVYTNKNGAALLARSNDAVFISFRGTNDLKGSSLLSSPDAAHWRKMDEHFALFQEMLSEITAYIRADPNIKAVFVTGHSLGGAMAEAATIQLQQALSVDGISVEGITFASPGYPHSGTNSFSEDIYNFWTDDDAIRLATLDGKPTGDNNIFVDYLDTGTPSIKSHDVALYTGIVEFLHENQIDLSLLKPNNEVNYSRVHINADRNGKTFSFGTGDGNFFGDARDEVFVGGLGNDTIRGYNGSDYMVGGKGNDSLWGQRGSDLLFGTRGNDKLFGGFGSDTLRGGKGADVLVGNRGKDKLFAGNDSSTDKFVYKSQLDSPVGFKHDVIFQFKPGGDKIDFTSIDANINLVGNQSFDFSENGPSANSVWFETRQEDIFVFADISGDSVADLEIQIVDVSVLNEADFLL